MGRRAVGNTTWLITYSDFITLLLVFFVVFYSLTPGIASSKLQTIISAFKGGEGVLNESSVIPVASLADRRTRERMWTDLNNSFRNRGIDGIQIDLTEEGNRIILRESLTFRSGDAQLLQQSEGILQEIAYLLDDNVAEVEVQGHTDNIPVRNSAFFSNWSLGANRAISVLRFLVENTNLPAERFKASSRGEFDPIASNDTNEGRIQNRRVEILVRYFGSEGAGSTNRVNPRNSILPSLPADTLRRNN